MKKYINDQSPAVLALIDCILASPGIGYEALAAKTGYSIAHTRAALSRATKTGKVRPVMVSNRTSGWFSTAQALAWLAERDAKNKAKAERKAERRARGTDRGRIVEMSADGVSMADIKARGMKERSASRHICALIDRKQLFRASREGCRVRWFATLEAANAWEAMPAMAPSEWSEPGLKAWADHPARKRRMADIGERLKSSARQPSKAPPKLKGSQTPGHLLVVQTKPGKDAPVTIKPQKQAPPDYSKAKRLIAKPVPYTCRWQQQPDSGQSIFADWPKYGTGS